MQLTDNSQWLGPGGSDGYGYTVFGKIADEESWDTIKRIMDDGLRHKVKGENHFVEFKDVRFE